MIAGADTLSWNSLAIGRISPFRCLSWCKSAFHSTDLPRMSAFLRGKRSSCSDASLFSTAVSDCIVVWFGSRVVLASPNQTRAIYRFTRPLKYCLAPAISNIYRLLRCDKRVDWISQLILRPQTYMEALLADRHKWMYMDIWNPLQI